MSLEHSKNALVHRAGAAVLAWFIVLQVTHFVRADPPTNQPEKTANPLSPIELFSKKAPAVVKLVVKGEQGDIIGSGSGFVVSAPSESTRHVVTNYHVIRAANYVNIEFHDGSVGIAETVVNEDQSIDLAILQVRPAKQDKTLPTAVMELKNTDALPIGTKLYAIGSPRGMKNTLSDGLLSGYRSEGLEVVRIQITNPISPGSSGGPVFTDAGAFVGVTTESIQDAQNLNFAIPAKKVRDLFERDESARPLWKGSCIGCEEDEILQKFYKDVFERFQKQPGNSGAGMIWR